MCFGKELVISNGGFCFHYTTDGSTTTAAVDSIGVNWYDTESWNDPFPGISSGVVLSGTANALVIDPNVQSSIQ